MIEHPEAGRVDPIAGDVHAIWRDSHERYGARKIKAALERKGRHRVQETHRQHHARTGHAGAYARGRSEPHGTRADVDWLQCIRQSDEGRMV